MYPMVSCRAIGVKSPRPAHLVAFWLHYGYAPKGGHICHKCGNKHCCNPYHLYHGTAKTNHADSVKHGTFVPLEVKYGEDVHNSKLTVERVRLIRKVFPILERHEKSEMAKLVGISRTHLRRIAIGVGWSHC